MSYQTASVVRDYEIRRDGYISGIGDRPILSRVRSPMTRAKVLRGYATLFRKPLWSNEKYQVMMRGAFTECVRSLKSPIRFLLDHEERKCLGSTDAGLQLTVDQYGVAFELDIPDTPLGHEARASVENQYRTGMSIGFNNMRTERVELGGEQVTLLYDGELEEISLVPAGAVQGAFAMLVDRKECGPFSLACESLSLLADGETVSLRRWLRTH